MHRFGSLLAAMAVAVVAATPTSASAQDAAHACASVAGHDARLACYDAAFPPPQTVHRAEAEQARQAFGLAPSAGAATQAEPVDSIEARIVSLSYGARGERTLALDNDQTWRLEGGSQGHLAEGDAVRVRKAAMGSHMLVTPAGVALRARRVR